MRISINVPARFMAVLTLCFALMAAPAGAKTKPGAWVVPTWDYAQDSPPPLRARIGKLSSPVTSGDEDAVRYVHQGMNLILGFWDIEAYRSFLHASRLDPDCAMAYWGMAMCMLASEGELTPKMDAAAHRAFELAGFIDGVEGKELTQEEQGMIAALALFLKEGAGPFVFEMARVSANFPNNRFARLMHVLFIRDGYTPSGEARSGQQRASKMLDDYLEQYPDDIQALGLRVQMLVKGPEVEKAVAPAKRLASLKPGTAFLLQLPGLVDYRLGRYPEAAAAFQAARKFDRDYFTVTGVAPAEVPFYLLNLDQLALTLAECGRRKEALEFASEAASVKVDPKRMSNAGVRAVIYHGVTLPTRVHMRFFDWQSALDSLPEGNKVAGGEPVPSVVYYEALGAYLRAKLVLQNTDVVAARRELLALDALGKGALQRIPDAARTHQVPHWNEMLLNMDLMVNDLRAGINVASDDWALADVWWRTMADRQQPGRGPVVPLWPLDAGELQGRAHLTLDGGSSNQAVVSLNQALARRTESGLILGALAKALKTDGQGEESKQVAARAAQALAGADPAVRSAHEIGD